MMKVMSTENRQNESTFCLRLLSDLYYRSRMFLTSALIDSPPEKEDHSDFSTSALIGIVSPTKLN